LILIQTSGGDGRCAEVWRSDVPSVVRKAG
jgi:hypothetical protein